MDHGRVSTTNQMLHGELAEIWRDVDKDAAVNAAILTGAGTVFSAGGDLSIIQQNIDDFAAREAVEGLGFRLPRREPAAARSQRA
jgi:enoyl-CoA hydratase